MLAKAMRKNFSRLQVYMRRNGPGTGAFPSVWKALFSATVTSDVGQTQNEGKTINRLVKPARPYPTKLVPSDDRTASQP